MFNKIESISGYIGVISGFATVGIGFLFSIIEFFHIQATPEVIVNTVNTIFNYLFGSLNLVGFFIRPATIQTVVIIFTTYYLVRLSYRSTIVFFRIGRVCYSYLISIISKSAGFIIKLLGAV